MSAKLAIESQTVILWKTGNKLKVEAPETLKTTWIGINHISVLLTFLNHASVKTKFTSYST